MIKLFRERPIQDAFSIIENNIPRRVNNITDSGITGPNLAEHIKTVTEGLQIRPISIDFEDRKVDLKMVNLKGNRFPAGFDVTPNGTYPCALVEYEFKANGNQELLSLHPRTANFNRTVLANINGNVLTIGIQTLYGNSELNDKTKKEVKSEISGIMDDMKNVIDAINNEVSEFNKNINQKVTEQFNIKKAEIEKKEAQKSDLNDL
tara:strand:+ start:73 stop:690 length:618 start_codon:yes stop_codon:yes gene_type:complete